MTTTVGAPTWHTLASTWRLTPVADLLLAVAAIGYGLLVWRHTRDRAWPPARTSSAVLAVAALVLALNTSMAVYAARLFWVHMLVHLLLIMAVPVLLVWAQPIRLLRDGSGTRLRSVVDSALGSRAFRVLTAPPFTVPLYTAVLVLTHLTGFQQAMATHLWIHDAETALYLISGYLLFLPLLGTELTGRWLVYPLRFVVLALCMGPDTLVGVALMLGSRALAPAYAASHPGWGPGALTDQRTAGAVMWVVGDGLMMLLMIITVLQWVRAGEGARGLGPWLETIRRQATVGDAGQAGADRDVDDDEAALAAYNARLASLSAPVPHHQGNPPEGVGADGLVADAGQDQSTRGSVQRALRRPSPVPVGSLAQSDRRDRRRYRHGRCPDRRGPDTFRPGGASPG